MLEQFLTAQKTHKKLIKYLLENMKRNPPSNYQLQIETFLIQRLLMGSRLILLIDYYYHFFTDWPVLNHSFVLCVYLLHSLFVIIQLMLSVYHYVPK